jgi:hypothetical protein
MTLVDCLLTTAAVFVLVQAARTRNRLPIYAWMVLPPLTLLVIALMGAVVRGDSLMSSRVRSEWIIGNAVGADVSGAIPLIGRMTFSLTVVAVIVIGISAGKRGSSLIIRRIMYVWATGAAVSGAYAIVALTSIGRSLNLRELPFLTYLASKTRLNGLAHHPNSLGLTIALAFPMLIYMATVFRGRPKAVIISLVPVSALALFMSGSRGALLLVTVLSVTTFAYLVGSRKRISVGALLFVLFLPALAIVTLPRIIQATRIFSKDGQQSTEGRLAKVSNGIEIFYSNPLFGAGVGSWSGELVPLILLTSGGVFYTAIFYGSLARPLLSSPKGLGGDFAAILLITSFGVLFSGFLNNGYVERYQYWPFAALFALGLAHGSPNRQTRHTDLAPCESEPKHDAKV